jgi:hypothetical protein
MEASLTNYYSPDYLIETNLIVKTCFQIEELVCPPPPVAPRSPGKRARRLSDSGSTIFDEDYEGPDIIFLPILLSLLLLRIFFSPFSFT